MIDVSVQVYYIWKFCCSPYVFNTKTFNTRYTGSKMKNTKLILSYCFITFCKMLDVYIVNTKNEQFFAYKQQL